MKEQKEQEARNLEQQSIFVPFHMDDTQLIRSNANSLHSEITLDEINSRSIAIHSKGRTLNGNWFLNNLSHVGFAFRKMSPVEEIYGVHGVLHCIVQL